MTKYKHLETFFDVASGGCAGLIGYIYGKENKIEVVLIFAWALCVVLASACYYKQKTPQ